MEHRCLCGKTRSDDPDSPLMTSRSHPNALGDLGHRYKGEDVRPTIRPLLPWADRECSVCPGDCSRAPEHAGNQAHETAGSAPPGGRFAVRNFRIGARLLAWKLAQGVSYLPRVPYHPILELQGAISSGDKNPQHADLRDILPAVSLRRVLRLRGFHERIAQRQCGPSKSLLCNFRRVFRSMSTASFYGDTQTTTDGLYSQSGVLFAHRTDIAIALRGCDAGFERYMACGQTHYRDVLGGVLHGWTIPSRNTQPPGKDTTFFSTIANYNF